MRIMWTAEMLHEDCTPCSDLADEILHKAVDPEKLRHLPSAGINDLYTNYGVDGHSVFVFPQILREQVT